MRFPLKRAGVLLLVLVLCLAVVGVGYGKWAGTLHIQGIMGTAESGIVIGWTKASSSDEGAGSIDDSCTWNWVYNLPQSFTEGGNGKDVGNTTAAMTVPLHTCAKNTLHETVIVNMTNVYPCYAVDVELNICNAGPLSAKIVGWKIQPLAPNNWDPDGFSYIWNGTAYALQDLEYTSPPPYGVSMYDGGQMIIPPDCLTPQSFDLVVHIEQSALQNTSYAFSVEVYAEAVIS